MVVRLQFSSPLARPVRRAPVMLDPLRAGRPQAGRGELWLWTVAAGCFLGSLAAYWRAGSL